MLEVWNGIAWELGASDLGRLDCVQIYMRQNGNGHKPKSKDDAADDDDDNESDKSIAIKRCYNGDYESGKSLAIKRCLFSLPRFSVYWSLVLDAFAHFNLGPERPS